MGAETEWPPRPWCIIELMPESPRPPVLRLPETRQPIGPALAGSVAVHAILLALLIWQQSRPDEAHRVMGRPGELGGGGGSQLELASLMSLRPPPGRRMAASEREVALALPPLPKPTLQSFRERVQRRLPLDLTQLSRLEVTGAPTGRGDRGAGSGTGGGMGSGRGAGAGSGAGPGVGGEGGDVYPPEPKQIVLPPEAPPELKGQVFTVRLWIDPTGRVTRVEVDPPISDSDYRRKFLDRMYQLAFYPARTRDGRAVSAQFAIAVTP